MQTIQFDSRMTSSCMKYNRDLFDIMCYMYDTILDAAPIHPNMLQFLKKLDSRCIVDTSILFTQAALEQDDILNSNFKTRILYDIQLMIIFLAYMQETLCPKVLVAQDALSKLLQTGLLLSTDLYSYGNQSEVSCSLLFKHKEVIAIESSLVLPEFYGMRHSDTYIMVVHKKDKVQFHIPSHPMFTTYTMRDNAVSFICFTDCFSNVISSLYLYLANLMTPQLEIIGDKLLNLRDRTSTYVSLIYNEIPVSAKNRLPVDKQYAVLLYREVLV